MTAALVLGRNRGLAITGVYLGIFVVSQCLATTLVVDDDFKTLTPLLDRRIVLDPTLDTGIVGVQHVTTDRHGFRTTLPIDYGRKAGMRVFMVDASAIEQIALDDRATSAHLLQEMLTKSTGKRVEVINAALSGTRAVHHLATIRATLGYHPDLYVVMLGINDWNHAVLAAFDERPWPARLLASAREFGLERSVLGRALAKGWEAGEAAACQWRGTCAAPSGTGMAGTELRERRRALYRLPAREFRPAEPAPEYRAAVKAMIETCRKAAVRCVFATQPNGYKEATDVAFRATFWMTPARQAYTLDFPSLQHIAALYNRYLVGLRDAEKIEVCDLDAMVTSSLANQFDEVHFNTRGAAQLAAALHRCIAGGREGG